MSCNGCRVLRKGCREECMLRECLKWIESAEAQGHATLFVAKFFGRATLMSFLSSVPPNHRSALFQSLLYEAVGRTINPVNGAVGLLWTGNWQLCQLGVQRVLQGGAPLTNSTVPVNDASSTSQFHNQQVMVLNNYDEGGRRCHRAKKRRAQSPSEESETSTFASTTTHKQNCVSHSQPQTERKLLTLFF